MILKFIWWDLNFSKINLAKSDQILKQFRNYTKIILAKSEIFRYL